ncbi:dihydrodipicolinate reductase [Parvularcula bermudensis HTCC2503]|uniref:4-hydroxy-tetrahydrodipicolinate reductase n=1 Tax=Parvularcula bermudensis (strain ATCC BAA-594 / HTCC2503 / KCTC 12087) TaxID=314260 RepID=E0TEM2_PARBH|nr:4-hydroxy-tetrahydrodipicolinate reductase [Parvularcula bermudensis]ADM08905.1 dihydrodipicolinate reductase [Parvularcula bermudensis HTCC2503]
MKIALMGSGGQMGRAIKALAQDVVSLEPSGGVESGIDVVIDFSSGRGAVAAADACRQVKAPLVTGTTGLTDEEQAAIKQAAEDIPIVQSGNMSVGINVLLHLVEIAGKQLDGFDVEILETHHRRKIDAPSGTALMLGEAAARGQGVSLSERAVFERYGQVGPRNHGEIGFAVTRGGGVRGEHAVKFLAETETVTLGHTALDRSLFAEGALRAAGWVIGKPSGLYTMRDVLGFSPAV